MSQTWLWNGHKRLKQISWGAVDVAVAVVAVVDVVVDDAVVIVVLLSIFSLPQVRTECCEELLTLKNHWPELINMVSRMFIQNVSPIN